MAGKDQSSMKPAAPSLMAAFLAAFLGAFLALGFWSGAAAPAQAADMAALAAGHNGRAAGQTIELGIGKSYVVNLPEDASEVLVADPKIANAIVRSARKAYIIGVALGGTDVIFFDKDGNQILGLSVMVGRDLTPVRANLRTSIPDSNVSAQQVGDSVLLTGSVRSAAEAQTAVDIATTLTGSPEKVVNALTIEGRDQVALKVTVAEMERSAVKQLGIQWNANGTIGTTLLGFGSNPSYIINNTGPGSVLAGIPGTSNILQNLNGNGAGVFASGNKYNVLANIQALEQSGLLRTLAEPTLTAISGEKAEFLAGGEFPIPVSTGSDGAISVTFKKYGVGLGFTPVVMSEGRISLQIATEVSELTQDGAVSVSSVNGQSVSIPGLKVRRAHTTVEMPSGGSLAIAGLLSDSARQGFSGLPGLGNLPILGALFRSRDYQRGQTELVVIVTPYIIKPVARSKLARPDDNFQPSTDAQAILMKKMNRIYAPSRAAAPAPAGHPARVGYVLD